MRSVPVLHGLKWGFAAQSRLGSLAVVQSHVTHQGLLQILPTVKAMRLENIGNAPVEAFDHATGSGRSGLREAVLDAQAVALLIKLVLARGFALTAGKQPVGELLAVVGQQFSDLQRTRLVHGIEERFRTGCSLVPLDRHEHPARGAVDGHEQIAPLRLLSHLGQVLHVHVQVARLVALEAFVRLAGRGRLQVVQVAHAMAAQAAVQARAADLGTDELTGDGQQIIQRQQQRATQFRDHALPRGREGVV